MIATGPVYHGKYSSLPMNVLYRTTSITSSSGYPTTQWRSWEVLQPMVVHEASLPFHPSHSPGVRARELKVICTQFLQGHLLNERMNVKFLLMNITQRAHFQPQTVGYRSFARFLKGNRQSRGQRHIEVHDR